MGWKMGMRRLAWLGAMTLAACGTDAADGGGPGKDGEPDGSSTPAGMAGKRPNDPRNQADFGKEKPGQVGKPPGGHAGSGGYGGSGGYAGSGGHAGTGGYGGSAGYGSKEICDDGKDNDANGFADCHDHACGGVSACDCPAGDLKCEVERLARFWVVDRFFINGDKPVVEDPKLERKLLAKAQPDECFEGLDGGAPGLADAAAEMGIECETGQAKVNQAYVWGLTHTGDSLWFGTVANTLCLVEQGFLGVGAPQQTDYWVCEFGADGFGRPGDWRRPEIFRYDLQQKQLQQQTLPPAGTLALEQVIGLRSAGNQDGVVFLAGPSFLGGLRMFAFDEATGAFLGVHQFAAFTDIRSFVSHDGVLYAGVGADPTLPTDPGGFVLRWIGSKANPFDFEIVGELNTEAANLAIHDGRLYVTTWPSALGSGAARPMGLYQSPRIPAGGLVPANASSWKLLWEITDYDPDPVAAAVTGGGALASFEGKLFWGTMHVPFLATAAAAQALDLDANESGSTDAIELLLTALGTHRSISIFRAEDLEAYEPKIRVVYGEKFLPKYDPAKRAYTIRYDAAHKNGMGLKPIHGSSGVGNFFNAYTWSMQAFGDSLYIGTFDWSQVARVGLQDLLGLPEFSQLPSTMMLSQLGAIVPREGADLFRFSKKTGPWVAESLTGVGNDTNYGIRTMVADDRALYLGTANPMNLHPDGGWELLRLTPKNHSSAP